MTISEQLREAALSNAWIFSFMTTGQWRALCEYRPDGEYISLMDEAELRTFILLVAEALE